MRWGAQAPGRGIPRGGTPTGSHVNLLGTIPLTPFKLSLPLSWQPPPLRSRGPRVDAGGQEGPRPHAASLGRAGHAPPPPAGKVASGGQPGPRGVSLGKAAHVACTESDCVSVPVSPSVCRGLPGKAGLAPGSLPRGPTQVPLTSSCRLHRALSVHEARLSLTICTGGLDSL